MIHVFETNNALKLENEPDIDDSMNVSHDNLAYQPSFSKIPVEQLERSDERKALLSDALNITPPWALKRKAVEELTTNSLKSIKRMYMESKIALKECFLECVAPGQEEELQSYLSESSDDEEPKIPAQVEAMIDIYNSSDKIGQIIILSLMDKKYKKFELRKLFKCSKRQVNQAFKLREQSNGISVPASTKQKRMRLDQLKCEHLLDFLFSSGLLQDVAYGTTNLVFDNRDRQTVPHAVLTARYQQVIDYYLTVCRESEFNALSASSLYRILKSIKPSQRKSLAGLDNTVADGLNSFEKLKTIAKEHMTHDKGLVDQLEAGKLYKNTLYSSLHFSQQSCITLYQFCIVGSF